MSKLDARDVAEAMFQMVAESPEQRVKPQVLSRAMVDRYGRACTRSVRNEALRLLVGSSRCVYHSGVYIGGCCIGRVAA